MKQALRIALQMLLYVPLMALIGIFSSRPQLTHLDESEALVRLSFSHAAQRRQPCRERSAEELARLAPNMRAALDCPRERVPVLVELELDGALVLRREAPPAGLRRDGVSTVYHRVVLPAGRHRLAARLRDRAEGGFNYVHEQTLELAPGSVLLIDFAAARGGFFLRG